jgi:hypothetical protein
MAAFTPVQHVGSLLDNNNDLNQTDAVVVKTGLFRFANAKAYSCSVSAGGNPDPDVDALHVHITPSESAHIKFAVPKSGRVVAATAGGVTTVLTFDNHGGGQSHPFVVGDYVTLVGSGNSAWTTGVAHLAVTAVTDLTVSVALNSSGFAAFDTDFPLHLKNSIKIGARGDTTNGLNLHVDEIQQLG